MLKVKVEGYTLVHQQKTLLSDVSLQLGEPGVVALIGPANAGKSLLLAAISGRIPRGAKASGRIEYDCPDGEPPRRLEKPIESSRLPVRGTVFRALAPVGLPVQEQERRVEKTLKKAGLWETLQPRLAQPVRELSPAERLLLLPCRSHARGIDLLLLDDPTRDLDPEDAARFRNVVLALADEVGVLWATRALRYVSPIADRIVLIAGGEIKADTDADTAVVTPPEGDESLVEAAVGHSAQPGLDGLYHDLLSMGSRAERAIHRAVQSLTDQNLPVAREVVEGDESIDALKQQIQDRALGLIGRTGPVGRELRTLTTVIMAATDLERIADHATNIAEVTLAIGEEPLIKPLIDIPRMAEKAQTMVRRSLDAMVRRDVVLAEEVCKSDVPVDELYRELFEELVGFITDGGDAYRAGQALYLLFVARYLERVADHATNIAEHVIFMVKGVHIDHHFWDEEGGKKQPFVPH